MTDTLLTSLVTVLLLMFTVTTKLTVLNVNTAWRLVLPDTLPRVTPVIFRYGTFRNLESWQVTLATACRFWFRGICTGGSSDSTTNMEWVGGGEGEGGDTDSMELDAAVVHCVVVCSGCREALCGVMAMVCANIVVSLWLAVVVKLKYGLSRLDEGCRTTEVFVVENDDDGVKGNEAIWGVNWGVEIGVLIWGREVDTSEEILVF